MYSLPQEIEVWYIIPAIRKELAGIFVKKYEMTLEAAGEILGITKAAVSQYLNKKRAGKFKLPDIVKKEIEKSAEIIVKNNKLAVQEIQRVISFMRRTKCCCSVCRKYNKGILGKCGAN